MATRRGRVGRLCARVAWWTLLGGPSTSPLESATKTYFETHEELAARAEDPSLDAFILRVRAVGDPVGDATAAPSFVAPMLPRAHSRLVYGVL